jgi:hypothetical protein
MKTNKKITLFGIAAVFLVTAALLGRNAFAVVAPEPTMNSITPDSGTTAGGTQVTITGSNFSGLVSVVFDSSNATIISNTDSQIILKTPAHPIGPVNITITSGNIGTFPNAYTYVEPPVVQSLTPDSGTTAGGTQVTITGQHFTGITSVTFGGTAATVVSSSDTQIVVTTGAHAAGNVDVKVVGTYGEFILPSSYTYVAPPAVPTCKTGEKLVCSHNALGVEVNVCLKANILGIVSILNTDYLGVCVGKNTSVTENTLLKLKI